MSIQKEGMYLNGVNLDRIPKLPGDSPVLYTQKEWNYSSIDAIIISALRNIEGRKFLTVRPVKITINQRHQNSEAIFSQTRKGSV